MNVCPIEWASVDGKITSFLCPKANYKVMLKFWFFQLIFACLQVFSRKHLCKLNLNKFNFINY